jgi:hypothetical protein
MNIVELLMQYSPIVVIALLAVIAAILLIIALKPVRQNQVRPLTVDAVALGEAVDRIKVEAHHAADVSAVLKLMEQLDGQPDALELIKSYPKTVQAAAWLHYINTLGASLQAAQVRLQQAHDGTYNASDYGHVTRPSVIDTEQKRVDTIRAKLDAAIVASGQFGLHSVN